jgi:SAM-dependent methyltransferase
MTTLTDVAGASEPATPAEKYTHGYDPRYVDTILTQRRASEVLAFLWPHLRPGLRVLDCGCGPGSITADVAALVAPGEVVGIDLEPSQLEIARQRAAERGLANVRFEVGSVYELPFPEASFDVAYAHTVIQHVREPVRALREMRRVLKPGGVVGVRDEDWGTFLWEPRDALVEQARSLLLRVWQHDGGDPYYPRHQRRLLREAGFVRTVGSATARCYGTPERTRFFASFFITLMEQPSFVRTVVEQGWADSAALAAMREAVRAWGEHPDAYLAFTFAEAVGCVDQAPTASEETP